MSNSTGKPGWPNILTTKFDYSIIQTPFTLWPCILVAFILHLYHKLIMKLFQNYTEEMASRGVQACTPEWLCLDSASLHNVTQLRRLFPNLIHHRNPSSSPPINMSPSNLSVKHKEQLLSACKDPKVSKSSLLELCATMELPNIYIKEVLHYRKSNQEKNEKIFKFLEIIFKSTAMIAMQIFSLYFMYKKRLLFHPQEQWPGRYIPEEDRFELAPHSTQHSQVLPIRKPDSLVFLYYILGGGYHLNRAMSQFMNPSRKDFAAMAIHHWVTVLLIVGSWAGAQCLTGCLVFFLHECSDIFLDVAKIGSYTGNRLVAEFFFALFAVSWFVCRLGLFSFLVLWQVHLHATSYMYTKYGPNFFVWICCVMLLVLLFLHIYWSVLLSRVIFDKLLRGYVADIRSDNEKITMKKKQ